MGQIVLDEEHGLALIIFLERAEFYEGEIYLCSRSYNEFLLLVFLLNEEILVSLSK